MLRFVLTPKTGPQRELSVTIPEKINVKFFKRSHNMFKLRLAKVLGLQTYTVGETKKLIRNIYAWQNKTDDFSMDGNLNFAIKEIMKSDDSVVFFGPFMHPIYFITLSLLPICIMAPYISSLPFSILIYYLLGITIGFRTGNTLLVTSSINYAFSKKISNLGSNMASTKE